MAEVTLVFSSGVSDFGGISESDLQQETRMAVNHLSVSDGVGIFLWGQGLSAKLQGTVPSFLGLTYFVNLRNDPETIEISLVLVATNPGFVLRRTRFITHRFAFAQ